jgi:dipeptidyl-peptidase-4
MVKSKNTVRTPLILIQLFLLVSFVAVAHDQATAANESFKKYDFIDTNNLGIWVWSGGGQMTMNGLFGYPEIYKSGMAVSFLSDQRLYDNIDQERDMGLLEENEANYNAGSQKI